MGSIKYFFMFEDIQAAVFTVSISENEISNLIINKNSKRYLPIGIHNEQQLKKWILNRGIPATRDGIIEDLSGSGLTAFQFMLLNNGVSLTDHYWFCKAGDYCTWKSINLYENSFQSSYSLDLSDDIPGILADTNITPNASLKGDLKKKWIIDPNGVRRLVKGNDSEICRQSLCEVLASEIHKRQGASHTPYTLIRISSNGSQITGCECPNFTDICTDFVPAIDVVGMTKKPNHRSWYENYIDQCAAHGVDVRKQLEYQILSDFVITNTDRHLNNFGIIRRTDSLEWIDTAPIFDSGNAMFYHSYGIPSGIELLKIHVTSFYDTEVKLLKCVQNRDVLNLSKLPDDSFLYNLLKQDTGVKDEVNEKLVKAYKKKIDLLSDFQNGADLWDYHYMKSVK